ncbi:MAG: FAD-binding protein, partial [Burkholderiales bacterium]
VEHRAGGPAKIGITPVWICPVTTSPRAARFVLYPMTAGQVYVNFGFWDVLRRPERQDRGHFNRMIERKVAELGGIKSLCSESFFDEEEFARIYGGESYRTLKEKYDPQNRFSVLYAKCVLRA